MSTAISVYHGPFGRAALYHLDRPMTLHAHREGHLVLHVASAAACLSVGGLTTPCDPTHAVAVNPWEIHDFTPCSGGDGTICLVLYIKPNWFAAHDAHGRHKLRFARSKIQLNDQLRRLIQLISLRLEKAAEDGEFDQCLFALTDGCYRAAGEQAGCDAGLCADKTGFNDFRIRKSIQIMQNSLCSPIDMNAIARQAGLSRPHFFKLFRRQTGLTPHLYMNTLRVETAIARVAETCESVTEIGLDLGFSSQSSFTRFFSLNVGMAPTDYRRVAQVA